MSQQIFSQMVPFYDLDNQPARQEVIIRDGRPSRLPEKTLELGLTDEVWDLIESCWVRDPNERKNSDEVVTEIESLRHQMDMLDNLEAGNPV